jgi:hypothetical protein
MPVLSTLGALTTLKTDDALYWVITFDAASALVMPILTTFVDSNNTTVLGGRITTTAAGEPQSIKLSSGSGTLPALLYSASYGSNASTEGRFNDSVYDTATDRTVLVGQQEASISGNIVDCGLIRVFNANNSSYSAFLDPPTPATSDNDRRLSTAVVHANSSISAAGSLSKDPVFANSFITNYSQTGTKNWSKTITDITGILRVHDIVSNNILVSASSGSNNTSIGYLLPNGASFTNSFGIEDFNLSGDITLDTSNNLYFSSDTKLVKYDSSGNSISWVKQITSANSGFGESAFYDGNIYALAGFAPAFSKYTSKIVSINANTGAINWQNDLSISGAGTGFGLSKISANNEGVFALGTYTSNVSTGLVTGSVFLTLPSDGNIPGNGSYTFGSANLVLVIAPSTTTIVSGSVNLISANLGVANANAVSTVSSIISANTTQNYLFDETVLN